MKRTLTLIAIALTLTGCLQPVSSAPTETAVTPPAPSPQVAILEENPAGAVYDIPEPTNPPRTCATVTAAEALHLRARPDEKSEVISYLYNGEQLRLIGKVGAWWKVTTSDGTTGYANSRYLEQSPCPS